MYLNEIKNIQNFCIVPFSELNIDANSKVRSCCVQDDSILKLKTSDHNNIIDLFSDPKLEEIRQSFLNGERPDICRICWKQEDSNIISERQQRNNWYVEDYSYLKIDNTNTPTSLDLRISNKCNLKCRMCSEKASNLIAKEKFIYNMDISEVQENYIYDIDTLKNLKYLKLLGGEPSLIPQCESILRNLIKCGNINLKLHITTNATTAKDSWFKLVSFFSDVTWAFSLDSVNKTNDYIRSNSKYSSLLQNIERYRHIGKNKVWNYTVSQTVQIYNLHDYYLLQEELGDLVNEYTLGVVEWPDYLNIEYLPNTVKQKYLKKYDHNSLIKSSLMRQIDESIVYDKMWNFVQETNRLDTIRNTKFSNINKELWDDILEFLSNNYTKYGKTIK